MTRTDTRVCFLALIDIADHLGSQLWPNPNFWGMNRHFPAKRAKYLTFMLSNYCIDHNQILQNDRNPKYSLWVFQICPKQIKDGRRPPSWKILISSQPIDQFWWNLACWCILILWTPSANKISRFQKSQMSSVAIFKIRKTVVSPQGIYWLWLNLAQWRVSALWTPSADKFHEFKNSRCDDSHFAKSKNCTISTMYGPILTTFGTVIRLSLPDPLFK